MYVESSQFVRSRVSLNDFLLNDKRMKLQTILEKIVAKKEHFMKLHWKSFESVDSLQTIPSSWKEENDIEKSPFVALQPAL